VRFFLIVMGVATAAWLWYRRAKHAKEVADEVFGLARDMRLATRRLGFRRRSDVHPADCVEDPRLAVAGIVSAIAQMRGPLSHTAVAVFTAEVGETFDATPAQADDIVAFGRWIAQECGSPEMAARKLGAVVSQSVGVDSMPEVIWMIERVASADGVRADDSQYAVMSVFQRAVGSL
jgi:uncharacterized tellurite resistance protein B-like protein